MLGTNSAKFGEYVGTPRLTTEEPGGPFENGGRVPGVLSSWGIQEDTLCKEGREPHTFKLEGQEPTGHVGPATMMFTEEAAPPCSRSESLLMTALGERMFIVILLIIVAFS